MAIPLLVSLACAFNRPISRSTSDHVRIRTHLPTLTPTHLPSLAPPPGAIPTTVAIVPATIDDIPSPPSSSVDIELVPDAPVGISPTSPAFDSTLESTQVSGPSNAVGESSFIVTDSTIDSADLPISPTIAPATLSPTDTPTATVTKIPPTLTGTPSATATEEPTPTNTPIVLPTAIYLPNGWEFNSLQVFTGQHEDTVVLYGNLLNNTGVAQKLNHITGTFLDVKGQVIADEEDTFDYWPIPFIPSGGGIPFELTVQGIKDVANFDLRVNANPSDAQLRQDFDFSDIDQWSETGIYCLIGKLRNPGSALQYNLTIVAVLYDNQDLVVTFGEYFERQPQIIIGGDALEFEICADNFNQPIARYDLRAWGQ